MNLRTYQAAALRTLETKPGVEPLTHAILGLSASAGYTAGLMGYSFVPTNHLDVKEIVSQLGGVLFNLAVTASLLGYTLDELAAINVEDFRDQMGPGCPLAQIQHDDS